MGIYLDVTSNTMCNIFKHHRTHMLKSKTVRERLREREVVNGVANTVKKLWLLLGRLEHEYVSVIIVHKVEISTVA